MKRMFYKDKYEQLFRISEMERMLYKPKNMAEPKLFLFAKSFFSLKTTIV